VDEKIPFLGEIPIDPRLSAAEEKGELLDTFADSVSARHIEAIADDLVRRLTKES